MQEVYDFLKSAQTYFLATADGDQPRVRAFGTIDLFEDKLYIQTGKVKDVYKQLVANPKFELCAVSGMNWVRVTGTLVPDDRVEPKKHMLDNYPTLRGMYDENDDNTIVLYMQDCTATFASLTGSAPRTVEF